jgi:hypothetical protein
MQGTLSCSATNCVHNQSGLCSASSINIGGSNAHASSSTQCDTFAEKGLKNSLNNVMNMNVTGQFKQIFNSASIEMTPNIRCDAQNCKYNDNKICKAPNVLVNGPGALTSSRTCCETFIE